MISLRRLKTYRKLLESSSYMISFQSLRDAAHSTSRKPSPFVFRNGVGLNHIWSVMYKNLRASFACVDGDFEKAESEAAVYCELADEG